MASWSKTLPKEIKQFLYSILYKSKFLHAVNWITRHKIVILVLHGVVDSESQKQWSPLRSQMSVDDLRSALKTLSRTHIFVDFEAAVDMIAGRAEVVPNAIAVTLDDGYKNNMTRALPVLEEFGIKPVFFVPTGFIEDMRPFWFDRLDYIIQQVTIPFSISLNKTKIEFEPGNRQQLSESYAELRRIAKSSDWTDQQFKQFFDSESLRLENGAETCLADVQENDEYSSILGPDDLREMHTSGTVRIASHTVNHYRIDKISSESRQWELLNSHKYLQDLLNVDCKYFCYPNGSFDDQSRIDVEKAGYLAAVTSIPGMNATGDDLFTLKRLSLPRNASDGELLARVSGFRFWKQ